MVNSFYITDIIDYDYNDFIGSNKHIILNNNIFNMNNNKMYLLHITSNYNKIINSNTIYPSPGCMTGGIYSVPLICYNNELRLHNLSLRYIEEATKFAIQNNNDIKNIKPIIIKLDNTAFSKPKGINYLKNGIDFFNTYLEIKNFISKDFIVALENKIKQNIHNSIDFIDFVLNNYLLNKQSIDLNNINYFIQQIDNIPILGYIYFESFATAVMLNQQNNASNLYHNFNELYNSYYKQIVFELYPEFYNMFNLSKFKPSFTLLISVLRKYNIINNFNHFENDFITQLNILLNDTLFKLDDINIDFYNNIPKNINFYIKPLIGHQLRLVKINSVEYNIYKYYFNNCNSIKLWSTLTELNINILYNSIIPKGEVAIYPNIGNKISFFDGEIITKDNYFYIKKQNKLNITFKTELINQGLITMSGYKNVQ